MNDESEFGLESHGNLRFVDSDASCSPIQMSGSTMASSTPSNACLSMRNLQMRVSHDVLDAPNYFVLAFLELPTYY